jgi:hypothetical protein
VREAAQSLCDTIESKLSSTEADSPTRLVMYFDEARVLTSREVGDCSMYHTLCQVMNEWQTQRIFTLFLSTNSRLSRFAPPGRLHPSDRVVARHTPQNPFTEMPFDCLPGGKCLFTRGITLEDVSTIEYVVKFGRPL